MATQQRPVTGHLSDTSLAGHFRVVAHPPNSAPVDISFFRGKPTTIGDFSFSDPFGPEQMTITLPQVSIFEGLGQGDLSWARKHVNIDVIWVGALPAAYPFGAGYGTGFVPQWRWEGYAVSNSRSQGLTLQLKGALLQLDNFLAKPEFAGRPIPYEWAISRQFLHRSSLRLNPLKIIWPSWWPSTYTPPAKGTPSYLIPAGVSKGEKWTGLLTRETGSWDPVLTSYVQTLLSSMYSERGRWSVELGAYRQPVLLHRDFISEPADTTVVIDPVDPGLELDLSEDWEQTATTVFGQGTSLSGVTYSGMSVSSDGSTTSYEPLAALRQVWPEQVDNGWLDEQVMAKEVMVQMQAGLSADDAAVVARAHLARFSDPGLTGTITLSTDPTLGGVSLPRHLVRAGMDVHIPGILGRPEGVLAHISKSSHSPSTNKTTLTVDTKFRDALTVEEVRTRGRDALQVSRMLIAGQYQPPIPDQVLPWSYAEGSGIIPSNNAYSAVKLFSGMPNSISFPWTDWTTQHPPRDSRWRSSYLRLGPAQPNADLNWVLQSGPGGTSLGVPIKMAQAGSIRLLQVAAYDANGNVMQVPFHISFYYSRGVNNMSMPQIPVEQVGMFRPYAAGQHYPFVRDGFEEFNQDGTRTNPNIPQPTQSVGMIRAYGTFYEKAGYFPGSYGSGDAPTGMLVDENTWSFDSSGFSDSNFDPYSVERNLTNPMAGQVYAMIYCDAQQDQEVFFLGRMFRVEPGQGG